MVELGEWTGVGVGVGGFLVIFMRHSSVGRMLPIRYECKPP